MLAEHPPFSREEGLLISEIDVDFIENERRRISTFPSAKDENYRRIAFHMRKDETALTRKFAATPFVPTDLRDREHRCEMILAMQAYGLKTRIEYSKCQNAVIGISGGLDSCLALLVIVKTMDLLNLPRTNIIAVNMPCFGTTQRTISKPSVFVKISASRFEPSTSRRAFCFILKISVMTQMCIIRFLKRAGERTHAGFNGYCQSDRRACYRNG